MGIATDRAIDYYVDQTIEQKVPFNVSAACIPYLSPTGMVQPVLFNNPIINSKHRYLNHYSFLQSASDHLKIDTVTGNYGNYQPNMFTGAINSEETKCITNNAVYDLGLVSSKMNDLMRENIKGLNHTFTIRLWPFKKKWTKTLWIWKRTYHRLESFENMSEVDYVLKYVLRP